MELRLFVRQLDQLAATIRSPISPIGDQHKGATGAAQGQRIDHKAHTNRTCHRAPAYVRLEGSVQDWYRFLSRGVDSYTHKRNMWACPGPTDRLIMPLE